jgi:hypothetical protein
MDVASSYAEAVDRFIESAPWLGDADMPALVALRGLAKELDKGSPQAAMVAQFGLIHRALLKRAPAAADGPKDELDEALEQAGL